MHSSFLVFVCCDFLHVFPSKELNLLEPFSFYPKTFKGLAAMKEDKRAEKSIFLVDFRGIGRCNVQFSEEHRSWLLESARLTQNKD